MAKALGEDPGIARSEASCEASREASLEARSRIAALRRRRAAFIALAAPALLALMAVSLRVGAAELSLGDIAGAVLARLGGQAGPASAATSRVDTIVWVLRMPRVLVAALAGATLGMTGSVIQAVLKNPLASPYTLGVSASAGFGAALGLVLGVGFLDGMAAVVANAFLFSLIPAALVLVASRRRGLSSETVVLCGVALSYVFGSLNTLLQFIAEDDALRNSVFWLVGDLTRAALWQLPYLAAAMVAFLALGLMLAKDINAIKMGDEDAKALGVDVDRVKTVAIVASCLATAAVICFTGSIGFIGLLAPHIARLAIGGDERYLIPASGLTGACLLVAAEIVAKVAFAPVILPVGAVTALLGGPVLVYFLLRRGRG